MNKEIEDALNMLLHCSLKDTEYETQVEQYKIVRNYITNLQQENQKYKEVIDKAIEFTNKNWGTWCTHHLEYMTELQNILKVSDNNE